MRELKFSDISQKTPDMYSASSVYIGSVSKRADQEPQQFPTIEPFLLLSPFSPRWFSLHRGFFFAFNGWIPPVSGSICPPASRPTSKNLHPLEQSSRLQASRVQIPPASGRIHPLAAHPTSKNLHLLEQSPRWQAAQRPNPSSDWEDCPAETGILEA